MGLWKKFKRKIGPRPFKLHDRNRFSRPPEPLPADRRPLTPPSANHPNTTFQTQSLLFQKLTPEIRLLIYAEVLAPSGDELLHVASTDLRLSSCRCTDHRDNQRGWQHSCWYGTWGYGAPATDDGTISGRISGMGPHPETISGLLCSCRRVYAEAINVLYTRNQIQVRQTRTISEFPLVMIPQRLALIRSLHLDTQTDYDLHEEMSPGPWSMDVPYYWAAACRVVRDQMPGLRSFRLSLGIRGPERLYLSGPRREGIIKYLAHLEPIRHVPDYVVAFHWRADVGRIWEDMGVAEQALPFRIEVYDFGDQLISSW